MQKSILRHNKLLNLFIALSFFFQTFPSYALAAMPVYNPSMLQLPLLRYLSINSANPYNYFNFLLERGDVQQPYELNSQAKKLINYFFLGISLPADSFWVNLQPKDVDVMTSQELAKTDMGKILLEQDLQLKRDVAQYLHPDNAWGKKFWERLYTEIGKDKVRRAGITTSQRVWIVPDKATVVETADGAFIAEAKLKVLLENEYLQGLIPKGTVPNNEEQQVQSLSESLMKEIIIPQLTSDVNYLPKYAALRQIYYSLVLAGYFKQKYNQKQQGLIPKGTVPDSYEALVNSGTTNGLESQLPWSRQAIWQDYLTSYQKGEYKVKRSVFGLARMYFSGGINLAESFVPAAAVASPIMGDAGKVANLISAESPLGKAEITPALTQDFSTVVTKRNGEGIVDVDPKIVGAAESGSPISKEEIAQLLANQTKENIRKLTDRLSNGGRSGLYTAREYLDELDILLLKSVKSEEKKIIRRQSNDLVTAMYNARMSQSLIRSLNNAVGFDKERRGADSPMTKEVTDNIEFILNKGFGVIKLKGTTIETYSFALKETEGKDITLERAEQSSRDARNLVSGEKYADIRPIEYVINFDKKITLEELLKFISNSPEIKGLLGKEDLGRAIERLNRPEFPVVKLEVILTEQVAEGLHKLWQEEFVATQGPDALNWKAVDDSGWEARTKGKVQLEIGKPIGNARLVEKIVKDQEGKDRSAVVMEFDIAHTAFKDLPLPTKVAYRVQAEKVINQLKEALIKGIDLADVSTTLENIFKELETERRLSKESVGEDAVKAFILVSAKDIHKTWTQILKSQGQEIPQELKIGFEELSPQNQKIALSILKLALKEYAGITAGSPVNLWDEDKESGNQSQLTSPQKEKINKVVIAGRQFLLRNTEDIGKLKQLLGEENRLAETIRRLTSFRSPTPTQENEISEAQKRLAEIRDQIKDLQAESSGSPISKEEIEQLLNEPTEENIGKLTDRLSRDRVSLDTAREYYWQLVDLEQSRSLKPEKKKIIRDQIRALDAAYKNARLGLSLVKALNKAVGFDKERRGADSPMTQASSPAKLTLKKFNTVIAAAEEILEKRIKESGWKTPAVYADRKAALDLLKELKQYGSDVLKEGISAKSVLGLLTYCKMSGYGSKLQKTPENSLPYVVLREVLKEAEAATASSAVRLFDEGSLEGKERVSISLGDEDIFDEEEGISSVDFGSAESKIDPSLRAIQLRADNTEAGAMYGGIDLSQIKLELKEFAALPEEKKKEAAGVIKTLLCVDALMDKQWYSLAHLYFQEVVLLVKDNIIAEIKERDKLIMAAQQLRDKGYLTDTQGLQFLQLLNAGRPLSEIAFILK